MRFDYGIPTVFIGDYDLALEAYNGDACNSRPVRTIPGFESTVDKESSGEISGVGFSDGRTWHEGRKFMLQNINNFVIKVWPIFLRCVVGGGLYESTTVLL